MRHPARVTLLFLLLLSAGIPAFAQSATDFYVGLLRRGASAVEAGQYDAAATPLRIAAFGLVETVDHYQTALAYLAIAQDRLGNTDGARDSVRRLVSAERVEKKFGTLQLPPSVRTAFDTVAKKYLSPADVNALATGGAVSAQPRTQPVTTTRPDPNKTQAPATTAPQTTPQQTPAQQSPTPTRTPQTTPSQQPATQPSTTPAKPQTTTPVKPEPAPATTKPATTQPKVAEPKVAEPKVADPKPAETKPVETKPATPTVKPPAPAPTTTPATAPASKQPLSAKEIASRIASAERALTNSQLTEARKLYREVLDVQGLDRESLLRVVEGLYRARDFSGALAAFNKLGTLKRGEEPYGYYHAVALYETGSYDAAKKVLAAAIPHIEMTPDVVRYRTKIEGAR